MNVRFQETGNCDSFFGVDQPPMRMIDALLQVGNGSVSDTDIQKGTVIANSRATDEKVQLRLRTIPCAHDASSCANARSIESLPRAAISESPSGQPSEVANGRETCGSRARPATHNRLIARLRKSLISSCKLFLSGAMPGTVGNTRTVLPASSASIRRAIVSRFSRAASTSAERIVDVHSMRSFTPGPSAGLTRVTQSP